MHTNSEDRAPKLLHVGRRPLQILRRQRPAIQGRRVGEWHRKHRSAQKPTKRCDPKLPGCARLLRRSPTVSEMDGEASRKSVSSIARAAASLAGERRFESCQPDVRGRGGVVLASLMSSRPWVRIPPALPRGRSSDDQSARLSGERPPVRVRSSPLSWWPWRRRKHGVLSPAAPVRARPVTPSRGR